MSHQLRYTVIGQMSYHFRCIYCIPTKMMTHFIKNFIKITIFNQDQDLSGLLKRSIVSLCNKEQALKSLFGPMWSFIEKSESPCKVRNPLATLNIIYHILPP